MLAMNRNDIVTAKSMEMSRSKLSKVGILFSFVILLEIASFVTSTDAYKLSSPTDNLPDNAFESSKRAGFVGMRGKKSEIDDFDPLAHLMWNPSWPSLHKRAGFVGMRGKKSYGFDNQGDLLQYLATLYQQNGQPSGLKRAGFVGMRGKKSTGDESTLQKRAAFVGMRGRRAPAESGYEELYLPYVQDIEEEKRAGFVGMRG